MLKEYDGIKEEIKNPNINKYVLYNKINNNLRKRVYEI